MLRRSYLKAAFDFSGSALVEFSAAFLKIKRTLLAIGI